MWLYQSNICTRTPINLHNISNSAITIQALQGMGVGFLFLFLVCQRNINKATKQNQDKKVFPSIVEK